MILELTEKSELLTELLANVRVMRQAEHAVDEILKAVADAGQGATHAG